MTEFEMFNAGNDEAAQKKSLAWLLTQVAAGKATPGVLSGLGVTQTATASANVLVAAGAGVAQNATLDGASLLVNDTQKTLDVLTANPMAALPRNDIVVYDVATLSPISGGTGSGGIRVIVGTPNASPTDPTVPATAIPLARLAHAASATTVPTSAITSLRTFTSLFGGKPENKRSHWAAYAVTTTGAGTATVTHNAGFTPSAVVVTPSVIGLVTQVQSLTSTQFTFNARLHDGSAYLNTFTVYAFLGE